MSEITFIINPAVYSLRDTQPLLDAGYCAIQNFIVDFNKFDMISGEKQETYMLDVALAFINKADHMAAFMRVFSKKLQGTFKKLDNETFGVIVEIVRRYNNFDCFITDEEYEIISRFCDNYIMTENI